MKSILIFGLSLILSNFSEAAPVVLPCKSTVEDWNAQVAKAQPATKTCQLTVTRETALGECADTESYDCYRGNEWTICTRCILWESVSWTKTASLVCGGAKTFNASQTCSGKKTTQEKLEQAYADYDHSVSSIFIEHMAQLSFKLIKSQDYSNGSKHYFER